MNIGRVFDNVSIAFGVASGIGTAAVVGKMLHDKIHDLETRDAESSGEDIEISSEEFSAMQAELDDLRAEIELLKEQYETSETTDTINEIQTTNTQEMTDEISTDTSTISQTPKEDTDEQTIDTTETITVDTPTSGVRTDINLKEIDIETLSQSEANSIWKSYLAGTCEYDLNENNLAEFCEKFGFNINLAK